MFKEIEARHLVENIENYLVVDIRSPSEYREFHIPGAVNVPLFSDEEKRIIGEIYRLEGQEIAKEEGLKIISPKLYNFYLKFRELNSLGKEIVVYCWRGGMRSMAMCSFISGMGIPVLRLKGGYRAFRKYILESLDRLIESKNFIVITGKTGVGKTKILRILKEEGFPVLDIEGLAKDRGSAFGKVGISERLSQKMFDSLLFFELRNIKEGNVIVEDESRRIGNIHLPEKLVGKIEKGFRIEINTTFENRINIIKNEYLRNVRYEEIKSSIFKISKYIGKEHLNYLLKLLEERKYEEISEFLMKNYYDRKYKRVRKEDLYIFYKDINFAVREIKKIFASFCSV